jgi:hypothetical protein
MRSGLRKPLATESVDARTQEAPPSLRDERVLRGACEAGRAQESSRLANCISACLRDSQIAGDF